MKSPLKRFRGGDKDKRNQSRQQTAAAQLREFAQAEQDMVDMQKWCDSLLSAAATAANCTYELADALCEIGSCLLKKLELTDDEETGKVLMMLGKEQIAIQKLLNDYRVHINKTLTNPSESLQKEITTVEEMKRQCDEKRSFLDQMIAVNKEKCKTKNSNRKYFSSQDLRLAQEDYEQEVDAFVFRLKSLKQVQSRSLLTQAVRHHSAQLNLLRKGSETLESAEPYVKRTAAEQHIDCGFVELEIIGSEDDESSFDFNDDSELSFDYGQTEDADTVSKPKNTTEEIRIPCRSDSLPFNEDRKLLSLSAPIYSDRKFDLTEKLKELHASQKKKTQTYVLPTPTHSGNLKPALADIAVLGQGRKAGRETQPFHSSSLATHNIAKFSNVDYFSDTSLRDPILKEHNRDTKTTGISPLTPGHAQFNYQVNSSSKVRRHAFSGPLTSTALSGKLWSSTPTECTAASCTTTTHVPLQQTSKSSRVSPSASPPLVFSSKISELHALPRPPLKPVKSSNNIRHSAPLSVAQRGLEGFAAGKLSVSSKPSPLPVPPVAMVRSFSSPSTSQRMSPTANARLSEVRIRNLLEDVTSPPLSPMVLISIPPAQKTE